MSDHTQESKGNSKLDEFLNTLTPEDLDRVQDRLERLRKGKPQEEENPEADKSLPQAESEDQLRSRLSGLAAMRGSRARGSRGSGIGVGLPQKGIRSQYYIRIRTKSAFFGQYIGVCQ